MVDFVDWSVAVLVGTTFVFLGVIKLYGLRRGIVGGRDKPFVQKLCGT